jgi:Holliday junction resolvase RusA-like endonuclease
VIRHFRFLVLGAPATQGSKNPVRNKYTGRIHLVESSKSLPDWRQSVIGVARDTLERLEGGPFCDASVGVSVDLAFYLARPKGHYGSGRNSHLLKPSAPARPTGPRSDVDKLGRAILDALKLARVFPDDGMVVRLCTDKWYSTEWNYRVPGVVIQVWGR